MALSVYFSACVSFAGDLPAQERREEERPELKKWNKHANAGHFPSLSLRAECKCADLTAPTPATRDARDGKKHKRRGGDFLFFRVSFYSLKQLRGHEWRVNWMPWNY